MGIVVTSSGILVVSTVVVVVLVVVVVVGVGVLVVGGDGLEASFDWHLPPPLDCGWWRRWDKVID